MELTLNPLSCFVFVGLTVESILSGIDVESIIFVLCVWVQQLHLFYVSLIQSSVFYSNILGLCMHYRTLEVPR